MGRELLTVRQVSERTGLAVKTLYNLRYSPAAEGPPLFPLRNRLRCYGDDLDRWIADQAGQSNVTPIRQSA